MRAKEVIFDQIKHGDKVTIVTRFTKEMTGRAVRRGPWGWLLNLDGDTPGFATHVIVSFQAPASRTGSRKFFSLFLNARNICPIAHHQT